MNKGKLRQAYTMFYAQEASKIIDDYYEQIEQSGAYEGKFSEGYKTYTMFLLFSFIIAFVCALLKLFYITLPLMVLFFIMVVFMPKKFKDEAAEFNKNPKSHPTNKDDYRHIFDREIALKELLMNKFLAIFGNFIWTKGHSFVDIQNLVILPDNLSFDTDDSIKGEYEDVKVKMTEVYFGLNAIFRTILNHIKNLDALKNIYIVVFLVVALFVILPISNDIKTSLFWSCSAFFMLIWIMGFSTPLIILLLYLFNRKNRGLIVKMSMSKAFDGEIIVFEKGKTNRTVNKKLIKKHTKVELEDVEFNKKYAVYASSNQIEARYVLTTALIERIQNIKFKFNAEYIRFIFRNHSITMFIRTHNDLFRLVKKDKKTDMSEFSVLFEEIYSVLSLVDVLKLNINTGL